MRPLGPRAGTDRGLSQGYFWRPEPAQDRQEIYDAFDKIYPVLLEFRKS